MKVIVGLGNPGREYEATRHNAGWWFVEMLARVWKADAWRKDGESFSTTVTFGGQRVKLMKPQTFMNLSGTVLRPILRREGFVVAQSLLVVVDELAIPVGEFRFKPAGSAGGHNGLKSIEAHVKTQVYPRLRIGIRPIDERRTIGDMADFVLHPMPHDERELVLGCFDRARQAAELWVTDGTERAVSTFGR